MVNTIGRIGLPSDVDGTLLPAVVGQIHVDSREFLSRVSTLTRNNDIAILSSVFLSVCLSVRQSVCPSVTFR